ncbi:MAG: MCP four helix bundle domain-containing protein [Ignavibacteriae bacterium]|nr:MCP four helix bundle domain-containing protein [Ignavibacteriota bacterium]
MNWFLNLKVGTKLLSAFLLVALIAGFVGYQGIVSLRAADDSDTLLYERNTVPMDHIAKIGVSFQRLRVNALTMLAAKTPAERADQARRIDERRAEIVATVATLDKAIASDDVRKAFDEFGATRKEFVPLLNEFMDLARSGRTDQAFALWKGNMDKARAREQAAIEALSTLLVQRAKARSDQNTVEANAAVTMMLIVVGIAMVVAIGLGIFIARIITRPLNRGVEMMQEMGKGHLGTRLTMETKDEVGVLARAMDAFADDLQSNVIATMQKIAKGDLSTNVNAKDDRDEISPALKQMTEALRGLVAEAGMLSKAAVEGKLATRGNAEKFQGSYREIVQGVNATLDSVIGPLNVAAEYVDRISKGDIPAKITDTYNGDFNEIKNNLNQAIGAVNALVADAVMLSRAAVEGKLATRADASKHGGDFRKIVQGVNDTLDSVIGPLNVAAEYVDRISKGDIPAKITDNYNGDFNEIKNNLNQAINAVSMLVTDAHMLSRAAVEGKLATRADATKHQGDFRKIVQGVNETLDSVIGPLNVAAEYVDRISKGDIPAKITDSYNGDFNEIKNNLNQAIGAVNALVADAMLLSQAAVEGRLATRADAAKHQGDFRKIVQGVNDTLDAVIKPVQEGSNTLAVMATGDMTARMNGDYRGDLQLIKESINKVGGSLQDALRKVSEAVSATASASSQISSSTEEMAAGAQEQTSQAAEVASAVEEMTKTIMENSKNASVAAETAKLARVSAEQGGKVVDDTVEGMKRIAGVVNKSAETVKELGKSSDQIGEIIGVIDDIADQTNLLALNAAIEAARAGEQGRGFAVVADEVRKLAERTTKATKEIAGMIKKIQSDTTGAVRSMEEGTNEVERGIELADKAGASLKEIVGVSQKVTDMVTQIAAASEEQSSASEQISKNVEGISKVTGETAQGTQQIARAAEDLNRLTENLQKLISDFKLGRNDGMRSGVAVRENGVLVAG